jgi:hypothetical protein
MSVEYIVAVVVAVLAVLALQVAQLMAARLLLVRYLEQLFTMPVVAVAVDITLPD